MGVDRRKGGVREPPPKPRVRRLIALPADIFLGEDERLATYRLAMLARYATIFRVEEIAVYGQAGSRLVYNVLKYVAAPPYLRKRLFPLKDELRYAGLAPPLCAPTHPASAEGAGFSSAYRVGLVLKARRDSVVVDAGLSKPIVARGRAGRGELVTVKVSSRGARLVSPAEVPYYWGYRVSRHRSLREAIESCRDMCIVATSRLGKPVNSVGEALASLASRKGGVALLFGSRQGLYDIARGEGFNLDDHVDMVVNFVPRQGSYVIRTEEAVPIALSIIDFLVGA